MSIYQKYHGEISWWGLSPAINFLHIIETKDNMEAKEETLNILQIGAGDLRHIMKTILESSKCQKMKKLNIFIVEPQMENIARQLLLWNIIVEENAAIQETIQAFLEIFGNTLLTRTAIKLLQEKCSELIKRIANFPCEDEMQSVTLKELKYSERDRLEELFKFYKTRDNQFDLVSLWNSRLRWHLRERYDTRRNVFDWDYYMKLKERGASIVHQDEYFKWRESGVAFEFPDAEYSIPNKTLCSNVYNQVDSKVCQKGYWGDMLTGPFLAFGIENEDSSFFEKSNGFYTKKSQDVSYNNVSSFAKGLNEHSHLLADVKLNYCTANLEKIKRGDKFKDFFHLIYLSRNSIQHADSTIAEILKDDGIILTETSKFILDWNKNGVSDVQIQIEALLKSAGLKLAYPCSPLEDHHANFIKE